MSSITPPPPVTARLSVLEALTLVRGDERIQLALAFGYFFCVLGAYYVLRPLRDAHELLVLPALARLIGDLKRRYGVVIVDTPPALVVPDASLILREVPACVAVARSGVTRARLFKELVRGLPRERLIGEILNGTRPSSQVYGGYYYSASEGGESDRARRVARSAEPL